MQALERLLGLRIDLTAFYELAAKQPRLHQLSTRFRGVKPPRFPTVWEGIVNGVACQQLSLTVGIILLNRLSSACGLAFTGRNGVSYAFPRPEDLAGSAPETVRSLGFSGAKTRTLIELSREISERRLDLESLADLKNDQAVSRLVELRGVGRWTAEYALPGGGSGEWAGSTSFPATTSAPATTLSSGCACASLSTMIALRMSSVDGSHLEDWFTFTFCWTA